MGKVLYTEVKNEKKTEIYKWIKVKLVTTTSSKILIFLFGNMMKNWL